MQLIFQPLIKQDTTWIGSVVEIDTDATVLRGCDYRTDDANTWGDVEHEALATIGKAWS